MSRSDESRLIRDSRLAIDGGSPVRAKPRPPQTTIVNSTRESVASLINSGIFSDWRGGACVREFEAAFADMHGSAFYSVAVNSGTSALHLACAALRIQPGDEVIIPCAAYVSAASAVVQVGAVPVICDVDPQTLTLDILDASRRITSKTRAVIAVHFWGCPSDMNSIGDLAASHDLAIIEDCGQSHGAMIGDQIVGSFGDISCYSFAPRKHISTGQGGAVVTRNEELAETVRNLANKGKGTGWLDYQELGFSYVMPDFEALLGINGIAILASEITNRRRAADIYRSALSDTEVRMWGDPDWGKHVYFKMPIGLPAGKRKALDWVVSAIQAENVSCRPSHPPLSSIAWLRKYIADATGLPCRVDQPVAYELLSGAFEVETGPGLNDDDLSDSAWAVRKVILRL